jgi:hypothetical protein
MPLFVITIVTTPAFAFRVAAEYFIATPGPAAIFSTVAARAVPAPKASSAATAATGMMRYIEVPFTR